MGQRSISQLRFLDFVIALILGNIIAHPLSDQEIGLRGSMISAIVVSLLYILTTLLGLKWSFFKQYLDPAPIILIKDGRIQFENLSVARISVEYLFSELRKQKVAEVKKVSLALWEPGGIISVFMYSQYQAVTPADMKLETSLLTLERPIIIDGKINKALLGEIGRDQEWLKQKIESTPAQMKDIRLATIGDDEKVKVYSN